MELAVVAVVGQQTKPEAARRSSLAGGPGWSMVGVVVGERKSRAAVAVEQESTMEVAGHMSTMVVEAAVGEARTLTRAGVVEAKSRSLAVQCTWSMSKERKRSRTWTIRRDRPSRCVRLRPIQFD